jgi:hypothetical protein
MIDFMNLKIKSIQYFIIITVTGRVSSRGHGQFYHQILAPLARGRTGSFRRLLQFTSHTKQHDPTERNATPECVLSNLHS